MSSRIRHAPEPSACLRLNNEYSAYEYADFGCLFTSWLLFPLGAPSWAAVANAARNSTIQEPISSDPSFRFLRRHAQKQNNFRSLISVHSGHCSYSSCLQFPVLLCWWIPLPSLLCFLASKGPATASPIWMLCKVGSTLGSLNGQTWAGLVQRGRGRRVQGSVCSSPSVVAYFYTVCL